MTEWQTAHGSVGPGATDADAIWLDSMIAFVEEFRSFNRDVTGNQILAFLYIARHPGVTPTGVSREFGLNTAAQNRASSRSRNTATGARPDETW